MEPNEAPQDEVVDTPAPDVDETVDATALPDEDEAVVEETATQEPEQVADTPEDAPVEDDEEPFVYSPQSIDVQLPSLQEEIGKLPLNEDGTIDFQDMMLLIAQREDKIMEAMNAVKNQSVAEVEAKAKEVAYEQRAWAKAETVLPQMRENPEMRRMVQDIRNASIMDGGNLSPLQAAQRVAKIFGIAKESGAKAAQESVRVQKEAHLETSSTYAEPTAGRTTDRMNALANGRGGQRQAAGQDIIRQMIERGDIKYTV